MTDLTDKAVKIQGKDYILVKDRILAFNEDFPNGSIETELESTELAKSGIWVVKATVTPDVEKPDRAFTGYSQAVEGSTYINKTSALENAETSAIGRALAMMGIGVIDSVASVDEIHKAQAPRPVGRPRKVETPTVNASGEALPWEGDAKAYVDSKLGSAEQEIDAAVNESLQAAAASFKPQETKTCWKCGEIATYRSGTSKTGKPWQAYFCASDNRDHAEFLNS